MVVIVSDTASQLGACLDDLQRFGGGPLEVIVVDRLSVDGSADVALGHPIVDRVLLETQAHPLAAFDRGAALCSGAAIAFVEAGHAPLPSQWLPEGLERIRSGAEVSVVAAAPDQAGVHGVVVSTNVMMRLGVVDGEPADGAPLRFCERATAAGFRVEHSWADAGMATEPSEVGLVTVALCTDGRRGPALRRCLESIAQLQDDKHEVVVVENAERAALAAEVAALGFRHVHEPRAGLDVSRNRAIDEASGDVVAFVDDDCVVDRGWLTGLRVAFSDPQVSLVTGRVLAASLRLPTQRWFEAWFSFDRGPESTRFTRHDHRMWFPLMPSPLGTGCNMAFRRATFVTTARFDPALDMGTPVGGGGDLDIFAQFLDAGATAAYAADAIVRHHHRSDMAELRRQFFGYGAAQGALCFKYAVGRPGQRRAAVQFFRWRLREHRHRRRAIHRETDRFPMSLVVCEVAGQLVGPVLYLWSRRRFTG